jgi:hypothetical protein
MAIIMFGFSVCLSSCGHSATKSKTPPEPPRIEWGMKGEKATVPDNYDWFCASADVYAPEIKQ